MKREGGEIGDKRNGRHFVVQISILIELHCSLLVKHISSQRHKFFMKIAAFCLSMYDKT